MELATTFGAGFLDVTVRANIQIRGINDPVGFSAALAETNCAPSVTHDRARNILAMPGIVLSPHSHTAQDVVARLDHGLCATPELADLPGKFAIFVGPDAELTHQADIHVVLPNGEHPGRIVLPAAGVSSVTTDLVADTLTVCRAFLTARTAERKQRWRISELHPTSIAHIVHHLPAPTKITQPLQPLSPPPCGPIGTTGLHVGVRTGRLLPHQVSAITQVCSTTIQLSPYQSLYLPTQHAEELAASGLIVTPTDPWAHVMACAGMNSCASAHADTHKYAQTLVAHRTTELPILVAGCDRHCGRPSWPHHLVVANEQGHFSVVDEGPVAWVQ